MARHYAFRLGVALGVLLAGAHLEAQAPAAAPKRSLARLAAPWPDADTLRERQVEAESRRLFESDDVLEITLAADFGALNKERNPESTKEFPGVLTIAGEQGEAVATPVMLRTRGHLRLNPRTCAFVPIRVDFPKKVVKGTVFDGQNALKLVTHCQNAEAYEQHVLREYLAYRIFNLLTPFSFRARLVKATYIDQASDKTITTRQAMFIEDEDDVARRAEGRLAELPRVLFSNLDQDSLNLVMLFAYMVGNTDFSIYTLHNVRLVMTPTRTLYPVPYDFDLSGLVHPPYAIPDRRLGISDVRDRLYRGPCRAPDEFEKPLALFREKRDQVMRLVDSVPGMTQASRQDVRRYLQDFYSSIDRPASVKRTLVDGCKSTPTM
jgi:hypothetical protein